MGRVYLFADFGKGPRMVGNAVEFPRAGFRPRYLRFLAVGPKPEPGWPQTKWWVSDHSEDAIARSRRWWLVECENAEAGRRAIDWHEIDEADRHANRPDRHEGPSPHGRILGSGGQS